MGLTEQNNISIAEIVIYIPALFIGIWLSIRHGIGRNAGWLFMIIFSLLRIIGAALQLATISDPINVRLYIGSAVCQNVGLSPLFLVQLALLSRALGSIREGSTLFLSEIKLRFVELVVTVGLILSAIGGANYDDAGNYTTSNLSVAGTALMIAAYVLLLLSTVILATQISRVEIGQKRLVLAVGLSLPFLLVRLAYSAATNFGNSSTFNPVNPDVNVRLGMSIIMEMIVVAIVEGIGMTLGQTPRGQVHGAVRGHRRQDIDLETNNRK
ncbi:hypothetical protein F5B20DRAFT_34761 [Whalleya microplaca]|nr:hypothetical protein F5B20DRAFT_34761 [Whalleya microplaca]